MKRNIIPPVGSKLNCKNWQIEAAYRMIQHNLDKDVAEDPDELIVYGGKGKAARDWKSFDLILETLKRLNPDETLIIQSGKPVAVLKTHSYSPRVLIANSNLVPNWANWKHFDKLEADLAKGLMSINAVKGFEVGKGFDLVSAKGSESRDEMSPDGYLSNNSGGISGGISTGQDVNVSIVLKPTSSINKEGQTINSSGESQQIQVKGRHDPCVGVRATPIAEAMTALVIMDHFLRNRAQNADVVTEIPDLS